MVIQEIEYSKCSVISHKCCEVKTTIPQDGNTNSDYRADIVCHHRIMVLALHAATQVGPAVCIYISIEKGEWGFDLIVCQILMCK